MTTNVQYTLCGADMSKAEVFVHGGTPIHAVSNGVEQLYYPLNPLGPASGTGAYVFFKAEKSGDDSRQAGWLKEVLYSPDFDAIYPRPQTLSGTSDRYNNSLSYDLLGNPIEGYDRKADLTLPASMGPVPKMTVVTPGSPLGPFDTAEAAMNAMNQAVFVPSEDVAAVLTTGAAQESYAGWFDRVVTSNVASGGATEWYVEAALTDAAKSNLAETATAATRQIPVAEIAALADEETMDVSVGGCEPGFYYTLYGAATLWKSGGLGETALPETGTAYGPALCGADGKVTFGEVEKPSAAAGFFTIGVSATKGE